MFSEFDLHDSLLAGAAVVRCLILHIQALLVARSVVLAGAVKEANFLLLVKNYGLAYLAVCC